MNKRILGTFLWALAGWSVGSMLTFFAGLPAGLDITLAALLGGLVWFDPMHRLWGAPDSSASERSDERVAQPTLIRE